jgi:hypothetical protein
VITQALASLPATISQPDRDWAEATLAEHAQNFDPRRLRVIARRVLDQLDPDGPAPAESGSLPRGRRAAHSRSPRRRDQL